MTSTTTGVRGVHVGVCGCARVQAAAGVRGCAWVYTCMRRGAQCGQVCASVHWCAQVCVEVHWCLQVCVWDEFSEISTGE